MYRTPYICPTRALVRGTVPSQVNPIPAEKISTEEVEKGSIMNTAMITERTA